MDYICPKIQISSSWQIGNTCMSVPMYKIYVQQWFCLNENFLFLTINSFIYSLPILKES